MYISQNTNDLYISIQSRPRTAYTPPTLSSTPTSHSYVWVLCHIPVYAFKNDESVKKSQHINFRSLILLHNSILDMQHLNPYSPAYPTRGPDIKYLFSISHVYWRWGMSCVRDIMYKRIFKKLMLLWITFFYTDKNFFYHFSFILGVLDYIIGVCNETRQKSFKITHWQLVWILIREFWFFYTSHFKPKKMHKAAESLKSFVNSK